MQLTDMHIGQGQGTEWGPEQDEDTYQLLDTLLQAEQPDLLLISGDQLQGDDCDGNAALYYQALGEFLGAYGVPWAMIFGNHDDAPFDGDGESNGEVKTSREELALADQAHPLSLTQVGPDEVFGTSNYFLPIYASSEEDTILAQIALLDSGGGALPEQLDTTQVEWAEQHLSMSPVPTMVFQHIPADGDFRFDAEECAGVNLDEGFKKIESNAGMMDLLKSDDNVLFVAVGHNHGNDYCCPVDDYTLHVCFGKHSGYGGYSRGERGARLYQVEVSDEENALVWNSWVRMKSGDVVDKYGPFSVDYVSPIYNLSPAPSESAVSLEPAAPSSMPMP